MCMSDNVMREDQMYTMKLQQIDASYIYYVCRNGVEGKVGDCVCAKRKRTRKTQEYKDSQQIETL